MRLRSNQARELSVYVERPRMVGIRAEQLVVRHATEDLSGSEGVLQIDHQIVVSPFQNASVGPRNNAGYLLDAA